MVFCRNDLRFRVDEISESDIVRGDSDTDSFAFYAISLLFRAGQTDQKRPDFINRSLEDYVYFDCPCTPHLSSEQRKLLKQGYNLSRLFSVSEELFEKRTGQPQVFIL